MRKNSSPGILRGVVAVAILGCFIPWGCADTDDPPLYREGDEPEALFPTSLHATAEGMRTAFTRSDGFGPFSGVDYETIGCKNCHAAGGPDRDTCEACHAGNLQKEVSTCHSCHGRQKKLNVVLGVPDVHMNTHGMTCVDCHKHNDLHGTGDALMSMWEDGGIGAKCEGCHQDLSPTRAHTVHGDRLHCSSCHTASVVSCYNCHFDTFLGPTPGVKKSKGALKDWVFLMNDRWGKVRAATFQTLAYEAGGATGNSFVAFAPFEAHTVTKVGRPCAACHGTSLNKALQDYVANDKITVTWWNAGALEKLNGVIPVIDGKMEFQYLSYSAGPPETWSPLTTTTCQTQYYYGSPLTPLQIEKLKLAQTE